jgi:hypothetical protein
MGVCFGRKLKSMFLFCWVCYSNVNVATTFVFDLSLILWVFVQHFVV